jgi:hypothetical protein
MMRQLALVMLLVVCTAPILEAASSNRWDRVPPKTMPESQSAFPKP